MATEIKWTTVYADQHGRAMLDRIDVPGGAIYAVYDEPNGKIIGTAFVPKTTEDLHHSHTLLLADCGRLRRELDDAKGEIR